MDGHPQMNGGMVAQKLCLFSIPAVYIVSAVFNLLLIDRWFADIFRAISPFLDVIILLSFLGLYLTSSAKLIRLSSLLILGSLVIGLLQYFFLNGNGLLMLLSYNGVFYFIMSLLYLSGVIVLISDNDIRAKVPRLSMAYVFFLATGAAVSVLTHVIGHNMDIHWYWNRSLPFIYITFLFGIVQKIIAALFWLFIFKGPQETQSIQANHLKAFALPATICVIFISSALIIIYLTVL